MGCMSHPITNMEYISIIKRPRSIIDRASRYRHACALEPGLESRVGHMKTAVALGTGVPATTTHYTMTSVQQKLMKCSLRHAWHSSGQGRQRVHQGVV